MLEPDKAQITIWHMRLVCWITKATNTHSEYVICIAFSLQQWSHERASLLRYTCIACLVASVNVRLWQTLRTGSTSVVVFVIIPNQSRHTCLLWSFRYCYKRTK
jgi:hypothetical protein